LGIKKAMTSLRSKIEGVIREASRGLKTDGFTKVGRQLRREDSCSRQMFSPVSRSLSPDVMGLAVDYSIHIKSLDPFFRDEQRPDSYWAGGLDFCGRLGQTFGGHDFWWRIDEQADPPAIAADVIARARAEAFAFFEARNTDDKIFSLLWPMWVAGKLEPGSMVTLAIISKALRKTQECDAICENLMAKHSSEYFVRSRVTEIREWSTKT